MDIVQSGCAFAPAIDGANLPEVPIKQSIYCILCPAAGGIAQENLCNNPADPINPAAHVIQQGLFRCHGRSRFCDRAGRFYQFSRHCVSRCAGARRRTCRHRLVDVRARLGDVPDLHPAVSAVRMPVATAWSTPGAATLITGTAGISLKEATGAFLLSAALITVRGFSGFFERMMNRVPIPLACGMLAGVLLRFGLDAFVAMKT